MLLRWLLGVGAALAGSGWVALALVGDGFRRSFGASSVDVATIAAPPVVFLLVLLSVVFPANRGLLHATASVLGLSSVALLLVARESVFVAGVGLAFVVLWFAFYRQALAVTP